MICFVRWITTVVCCTITMFESLSRGVTTNKSTAQVAGRSTRTSVTSRRGAATMTDLVVWVIYLYLRRRRRWRWRRDADRCVDARLNIRACLACLYATPGDAAPWFQSSVFVARPSTRRVPRRTRQPYSLAQCTSHTWVSQSSWQNPFNLRLCLGKHLGEDPSYLRLVGIVEMILFIS